MAMRLDFLKLSGGLQGRLDRRASRLAGLAWADGDLLQIREAAWRVLGSTVCLVVSSFTTETPAAVMRAERVARQELLAC